MRRASAHPGDCESLTDLDRLHGLDTHQRLREHPVDAAIPVHVRAETGRNAVAEYLDHSAERVTDLRGLLDLADHVRLGVGVEAPHLRAVDLSEIVRCRTLRDRRRRPAQLDDVAQHRDVDLREERLGDRSGRDPRRGLARRRAFEDVAGIVEAVLLHPGQVGVAGTGLRQR